MLSLVWVLSECFPDERWNIWSSTLYEAFRHDLFTEINIHVCWESFCRIGASFNNRYQSGLQCFIERKSGSQFICSEWVHPAIYKESLSIILLTKVDLPVPLGPNRKNDVWGIFMSRFISTISANLDHICVIYNHISTRITKSYFIFYPDK